MRINRVLPAASLVAAAIGLSLPAWAQDPSSVIIQRTIAQSHGLNRAWLTHVEIDGGKDRVQEVVYWAPATAPPKKAGAKEEPVEVLPKKEPMEVEDLLPKPPPPPPVIPIEERNTLFVLSRHSVLHAIDAETGGTLWVTQVGSRSKFSEAPAIGKQYVAVVNGDDLHVLDRRDGGLVFRKSLSSVPSAAPAVGDEWVYVPMLTGNITAYKLPDIRLGAAVPPPATPQPKAAPGIKVKDTSERDRKLREKQRAEYGAGVVETMTYASFAPVTVAPLVTPDRLAWANLHAQLYLGFNKRPLVDNRFDMLKPVEAPLMYWPPYIYAASRDGYVYGVHERKAESPWRYSIGEPLYEPAVPVEDAVYAVGTNAGMFCLDAKSGDRLWWAPGIRRFLAVSATRVYAADNAGALQMLDRKSGARVDSLRIDRLDVRVINQRSDRIYLGTANGVLQCLHEIGQEKPLLHQPAPPVAAPEATKSKEKEKEPDAEKEKEKEKEKAPEMKEPVKKPAPKPVEKKPVEKKPVEKKVIMKKAK